MWDKILQIVVMGIGLGTLAGILLIYVKSLFTEEVEKKRRQHQLLVIQETRRIFGEFVDESLQKLPRLMKEMYTEIEKMDDDD